MAVVSVVFLVSVVSVDGCGVLSVCGGPTDTKDITGTMDTTGIYRYYKHQGDHTEVSTEITDTKDITASTVTNDTTGTISIRSIHRH